MNRRFLPALLRTLLVLVLLCLSAGCASYSSWRSPSARLEQRHYFYVESELADGHELHKLIAAELQAMGYNASSGYLTLLPKEADTIVSYRSRWTWDFKTYLIALDLDFRDARADTALANVSYHRPALGGTSTHELIRRALAKLVEPKHR